VEGTTPHGVALDPLDANGAIGRHDLDTCSSNILRQVVKDGRGITLNNDSGCPNVAKRIVRNVSTGFCLRATVSEPHTANCGAGIIGGVGNCVVEVLVARATGANQGTTAYWCNIVNCVVLHDIASAAIETERNYAHVVPIEIQISDRAV
jgi:hypothetical protein